MALPSTALRKASNALQLEAPGTSPEPMLHHSPTVDSFSWDVDPFEAMPDMTEHYLDHYFTNVNTTSYCMYPRDRFMEWVRRDREKTQAEKMLLYAMFAHGSVFSSKAAKTRNTDRKFFENIAREAMSKSVGTFSLPMVQTRTDSGDALLCTRQHLSCVGLLWNGNPSSMWNEVERGKRVAMHYSR